MSDQQQTEINFLAKMLFDKYNSLAITVDQTEEATQRSKVSLARDRAAAMGIPYTKLGKGGGSDKVMYSIYDVARFVVGRKQKSIDLKG